MPQEMWDAEMTQVAQEVQKKTGATVTYVMGGMEVTHTDGSVGKVRGVQMPGQIIVQADHSKLSVSQLANHEAFHELASRNSEMVHTVEERIKARYDADEYNAVVSTYIQKLQGIIDIPVNGTQEQILDAYYKILEEIYADAYAGINAFGVQASQYQETIQELVQERGTVAPSRENAQATERTTGPTSEDEVAREAAKNMGSDFYDEATGSCVVGNWETENVPTGETTIMFTFQMQGRWKISVTGSASGEEAGGNETDENEAGENGANENGGSEEAGNSFCTGESEEFVIDKEAPLLSVTYGNVKDISSARSSGANVNRPIQRGLHQITSPGCEVSAAGTGQVTIRVKEDYFIPENVKITVYKEDYETGEKKDVTKKFERYIVSESRRTADTSAQENRSIRRNQAMAMPRGTPTMAPSR